jgi:hypothetical protein
MSTEKVQSLSAETVLSEIKIENDKGLRSRSCSLSLALARLSEEQANGVKAAMADNMIAAPAIARWISKQGFSISEYSVRKCRRICDCWR